MRRNDKARNFHSVNPPVDGALSTCSQVNGWRTHARRPIVSVERCLVFDVSSGAAATTRVGAFPLRSRTIDWREEKHFTASLPRSRRLRL
ncbi:hypothetical protein ANTPLA_LOCUS4599 [Anthophora plagiata]